MLLVKLQVNSVLSYETLLDEGVQSILETVLIAALKELNGALFE
jgi:hypothetical protein